MSVSPQEAPTRPSSSLDSTCSFCGAEYYQGLFGDDLEDATLPVPARKEYTPCQREDDEHELSHWPYRSWCPSCVKGAAVNDPHDRVPDRTRTKPTIAIDYSFLSSSGQQEEGSMPILNIKDLCQLLGLFRDAALVLLSQNLRVCRVLDTYSSWSYI